MRVVNDEKPSKEFTDYWQNRLTNPTPHSSDPRDKPCYITEEMQQKMQDEGNWPLPPAIQNKLDQEHEEVNNGSNS